VAVTLSGTVVGARTNSATSGKLYPGYYRLDAYASYAMSDSVKLFGRIDNLTNNVYQDPVGYNAAGISAYVGLTWNH
jgi:vitamin B12 transporter